MISPDGTEVAFMEGAELKVSPLVGGIVRVVAKEARCCARWGTDGYIYFTSSDLAIHRVPEGGGEIEQVTTQMPEGDAEHGYFQVMPDGDHAVFSVFANPPRLETFEMSTGERQVLTSGMRSFVTSTGHVVFGTLEGQILAASFDMKSMKLSGDPVPLVQGVGVTATEDVMFTLSANGTLLYWSAAGSGAEVEMIWVSRTGDVTSVDPAFNFRPAGANSSWSLSPDGRRVAYQDNSAGGGDIWIKELDRGPLSRLTFDAVADQAPQWSADGLSIRFLSDRSGNGAEIWTKRADGTGEPSLLLELDQGAINFVTSPDEQWAVYRTPLSPSRDLRARRLDGGPEVAIAASPQFEEYAPALSPDGRWLAYVSDETGTPVVYVRPFPDVDSGRWQVSTGAGVAPMWAHNGRELFYANQSGMNVATLETTSGFRVIGHELLFNLPPGVQLYEARGWYDVSRDDQRLLMARPSQFSSGDSESPIQLILVENFFEELKARVR
jgi:serine/threonine-protein kinase